MKGWLEHPEPVFPLGSVVLINTPATCGEHDHLEIPASGIDEILKLPARFEMGDDL
jgi:hypothetical protein